MADRKISAFSGIAAVDMADADLIPVVDVSAGTTAAGNKRATVSDLRSKMQGGLPGQIAAKADQSALTAEVGRATGAEAALSTALGNEATARASGDTASRARANHTGTQAIATVSGLQMALDGEATARANGDTASRARANHTGTQAIATVSDLQPALDGKASNDSVTSSALITLTNPGGTGDAATFEMPPGWSTAVPFVGMAVQGRWPAANTITEPTATFAGRTFVLQTSDGSALAAGDVRANSVVTLRVQAVGEPWVARLMQAVRVAELAETPSAKIMTAAERSKLAGLPTGAGVTAAIGAETTRAQGAEAGLSTRIDGLAVGGAGGWAGPFQNDAAGIAATDPGEVFTVAGDDGLRVVENDGGVANELTSLMPAETTPAGGIYQRFISTKLGDVLTVADFGVRYGTGVGDQSAAMASAVNAALDSQVVEGSMTRSTRSIDLGAGVIRLEAPLPKLMAGVELFGRGNATLLQGFGAFDLVEVDEFESDGITPRYYWGMMLRDFQVLSGDPVDPLTSIIKARGLVRHCGISRVLGRGAVTAFDIDRSWTLYMDHCGHEGVNGVTNHHIRVGSTTGALTIDGGRYDVAGRAGLYADGSDLMELIVQNDCCIQFGREAAIEIAGAGARTVKLLNSFFEGNCIGNPAKHYLEIKGANTSLSSCEIRGNAINNLGDANRNGLGVCQIDGFQTVVYDQGVRWVRNTVKSTPKFGENIARADITLGTSTNLVPADFPFIGPDKDNAMVIKRPDRPMAFFGQAMDNGAPNPALKAALVAGVLEAGQVAFGQFGTVGAAQGFGTGSSFGFHINPIDGAINFGQAGARMAAGTNEFHGRLRLFAQATSANISPLATTGLLLINATGGARVVSLTNITPVSMTGRTISIVKTDISANVVTINATIAGVTINGAASITLTQPRERIELTSDGANWIVTARHHE